MVYGLVNFYVGLRGWQWAQTALPGLAAWAWWLPVLLLAAAFFLSRTGAGWLPDRALNLIALAGSYWLPLLTYGLLIFLALDLVGALAGLAGLPDLFPSGVVRAGGGAVILGILGVTAYGALQSWRVVVRRYEIAIDKPAGRHRELHIVLASDLHAGATHGMSRVRQLVRMVQNLSPDLLLIAGDIVDDNPRAFIAQGMDRELARLAPPLGTYAIVGNHDEPGGDMNRFRQVMERAGIRMLIDETVLVDESFYLIGRNDRYNSIRGRRPALEELLEGVDRSRPLILMDHQPVGLEEAAAAGIDLQVSGHTHRGQLWPFHLITRRIFELDWGYLRKGATHVIVSLGFGTWGPPVRVGNRPELVSIRIRFAGA